MPRVEHNGADFHYVVEYKQLAVNWSTSVVIRDWTVGELVVGNQPVFTAYEISVRAVNHVGSAPDNLLIVKIGHSGEDGLCFENVINTYNVDNCVFILNGPCFGEYS